MHYTTLGRGGSNGLLPGTLAAPSSVVIDSGATLKFNRGSNKSFFDILSGAGGVTVANAATATVRLVSDREPISWISILIADFDAQHFEDLLEEAWKLRAPQDLVMQYVEAG